MWYVLCRYVGVIHTGMCAYKSLLTSESVNQIEAGLSSKDDKEQPVGGGTSWR
jgi:hypothetical protein